MIFKSGFIAIVGRPNAGKSTLLNQIMHQKVAIVSNKAQTTRNSIRAIVTTEDAQIAAISLSRNLPLATRNTKDFLHIEGVLLHNPWSQQ